jgi:hypothetical protein
VLGLSITTENGEPAAVATAAVRSTSFQTEIRPLGTKLVMNPPSVGKLL